MNVIETITLRRILINQLCDEEGIGPFKARNILRKAESVSPEELAAATGMGVENFHEGIYSETTIRATLTSVGFSLPVSVGAIGDGSFFKWLFSDEGMAALLKFAETLMKLFAIFGFL